MTEPNANELHMEYERISALLGRRLAAHEREGVKADIVALFHETDAALAELTEFKESIRELIARFKALPSPVAEMPTTATPPVTPSARAPVTPPVTAPPVATASTQSIRHDHLGASSYIERGWSALAAGHWPDAELHLSRAVALDGTSATAQALLAWALVYRGRSDDALQHCQSALGLEPDHGLAHVVIGAICLRKGILGEAIEHLSRVAKQQGDPRAVLYANYWLGVAYLERDMSADAEEVLRRAVTLGPNLAEGWLELGHVLWRRNRTGEARDAWQKGARILHSPHSVSCRQLIETVATGGNPTRTSPY